jgi:hypothetical protein
MCSEKCEGEYLNTLPPSTKEQMNTLRSLDARIDKTKLHEKVGWMIAGFGLLTIAIGFLTINVTAFMVGVFPLASGALFTEHFEGKRNKLTHLRKQIVI